MQLRKRGYFGGVVDKIKNLRWITGEKRRSSGENTIERKEILDDIQAVKVKIFSGKKAEGKVEISS